jgi:hypothetical protein
MMKLPSQLTIIRDQVVDHVRNGTPLPDNLSELINWYETEAWDDLVDGWGDEYIVLKLSSLAWLGFSDSELIANQESDEPVTNELRIAYARQLIAQTLESCDGYDCPTVHAVELKKDDGSTAVLGWTMEIHGQGGAVALYQGAFSDLEHFYQSLRDCDFLFPSEQDQLTDEAILGFWTKPWGPTQPIVISVKWGDEPHDCPMSEKTWKRIVQGKAVRRVEPYWYEGKKYKGEWLFNSKGLGQLTVNYDDGGVGFEGELSDATITNDGEDTSWVSELQKYALTSKKPDQEWLQQYVDQVNAGFKAQEK